MKKLILLALVAGLMTACDNNKRITNKQNSLATGYRGTNGAVAATVTGPINLSSQASAVGGTYIPAWITLNGSSDSLIRTYLSNVINPSDSAVLGPIEPTTAVKFSAFMDVNGSSIYNANTLMYLQVSDQWVGQAASNGQQVQPFTFSGKAQASAINTSTGEFKIQFVDSTGTRTSTDEVWLVGTYKSNGSSLVASGSIWFKNYSSVSPDYTATTSKEYQLGTFTNVNACSLFICKP